MSKFKLDISHGIILCKAKISHRNQSIFLKLAIDTGASKTIIPPESSLSIGINPVHSKETTEITTGSGTVICPIVTIPKFSCLGITVKKLDVVCHNLPPESPVEGLLGLNFLKVAKIIFDFPNNSIEVIK